MGRNDLGCLDAMCQNAEKSTGISVWYRGPSVYANIRAGGLPNDTGGIYRLVFARDSHWVRHSLNYFSTLTLTLSTRHCSLVHREQSNNRSPVHISSHSSGASRGGFPPRSGGKRGSSSALLSWEPTMGDGWVHIGLRDRYATYSWP